MHKHALSDENFTLYSDPVIPEGGINIISVSGNDTLE